MSPPTIVLTSLREQVYEHLKQGMGDGRLLPGAFLDLDALAAEIGISRTPLREALLLLEAEGFVEILPRRGVRVVELTLEKVRDIYEMIGALESAALRGGAPRVTPELVERMGALNAEMLAALEDDDFDRFYSRNLEFHDGYLDLSTNVELRRQVSVLKQRLYDFPRNRRFIKEWELASTREHAEIVRLLAAGQVGQAADYVRDVHWSYAVQEPFIQKYHDRRDPAGAKQE